MQSKTEEVKTTSVPVSVASVRTSTNGAVKEVEANSQTASSTIVTTVTSVPKTEEVKVESISTVVAGVVEDLKNVEVGVGKEAASVTGRNDAPSVLTTIEGGLQIVQKEVIKGVGETVTAVEEHPELIAE